MGWDDVLEYRNVFIVGVSFGLFVVLYGDVLVEVVIVMKVSEWMSLVKEIFCFGFG